MAERRASIGPVILLLLLSVGAIEDEARADALLLPADVKSGSNRAYRAVTFARAERSLAEARSFYAESRFDLCLSALEPMEIALASIAIDSEGELLLKTVNQWIGLCASAERDEGKALAALKRAAHLPGPPPDPELFPPKAMALHKRAESEDAKSCVLDLAGAPELWIDGKRLREGEPISRGEHYVRWGDRAGKIDLSSCSVALPAIGARTELVILEEEERDPAFLKRVLELSSAPRLLLIGDSSAIAFDRSGEFSALDGAAIPKPAAAERDDEPSLWWAWILIGAAAGAAIAAPIALSSGGSKEESFRIGF
jgi:hypothetical protein